MPSGRVSEMEGTGRAFDCDATWDWPSGGASSWGSEEARDKASDSVNTEAREAYNDHKPRCS